jgi:hypothetical protein
MCAGSLNGCVAVEGIDDRDRVQTREPLDDQK